MSFVKHQQVDLQKNLLLAHYKFPRSQHLREAFEWMVTDYYAKASLEEPFEARGILLTGPTRIGKSTEARKLLAELNDGSTLMPDGRPVNFTSVTLDGHVTWRDLGIHTLRTGLSYKMERRRRLSQRDYWDKVLFQAKAQGVVGIHYDECQHIFSKKGPEARAMILDSFKSMLKQPDWPFMLLLSGIGELAERIQEEEQLAHLLRPVTFREIDVHQVGDLNELNSLCHAYAERAGYDFANLSSVDFYRRLGLACGFSWGLVVELMIAVLINAGSVGAKTLSPELFCGAFTTRLELAPGFSPFTVDDYEELFLANKILDLWNKSKS
ncbi:AAA family ATPase [uncultured Ruegeria sp.]|uniref:AAA family ATPase n=1 Tax=uncultured Ruegeria sp. TaxID=259304 RepID=UPI002616DB68|nr:AAA family ATPase [uncultured Ruegeria sp.]